MQENGVANVAKYLGMAVDIGDSAQEVAAAADKAFKAAKKLAASLSVWGSVFGALASQTPSAKDILDSVNTAFEEMARNVNNAFSDMQGYVDGEVLEAQKARWQDDYAAAYASFKGCLELEPLGDEKVNDCMVESERFSKTHKAVYMDYEPYMSVDTWDPTPKDIRHMEVQFLVFRDYVSLRVMMLLTLINTFQPLPDHDHQELTRIYYNHLIDELENYIEYANFCYHHIKAKHNTENDYFKNSQKLFNQVKICESLVYTASTTECTMQFSRMFRDSQFCHCDFPWSHTEAVGHKEICYKDLVDAFWVFNGSMLDQIKNFWEPQVMNYLPKLQEIHDEAVKARDEHYPDHVDPTEANLTIEDLMTDDMKNKVKEMQNRIDQVKLERLEFEVDRIEL